MRISNRLKCGFGGALVLPWVAILAMALPGGATADAKTSAKPSVTLGEFCSEPSDPFPFHGVTVLISGLEPFSSATIDFSTHFLESGLIVSNSETFTVDETGTARGSSAEGEPFIFEVTVRLPDGRTLTASREIDCSSREPASAEDCKNGGWRNFSQFKNQGDCVSFVATNGKNSPAS